ncbi:MAG: hypothetical protein H0V68_03330 [Actinobacteria bacterium]|nr:hypothetical protein [Actinomycetota bacterium]
MSRVRGFAAWSPQRRTLALLEQVDAVLVEYRAHLPLTLRQVQAEALPPDTLADEVRREVARWLDHERLTRVVEAEHIERAELVHAVEQLRGAA